MAGIRGDILAGRSYVELYVKNNRFLRGLRDARQKLNQFGADMQAFGRQMVTVSASAIIPIAFAAKRFADFDDAMRGVAAVSQATDEQFKMLNATAKDLGATTSFTAVEVANLMAELGRAGFDPSQINVMTESVLALARATGTEAALASGIMAASIRQFGLEANDAGRVADGLTAAANKSFNTVEMLGEALSYAGPVARDFNLSFEDTLAILGGLGNVGVQASNAGTTLRRLLTITGAEAEKLQGIFGVSFVDAAGNARPLVDVLGEVNDATADLGTAARAQKFNEAFGLLGITGASALGRSVGDIRELADEIKAAGGIAASTAAEMDGGLGGVLRRLMSAAEGAAIAIGESLEGEISSLGDAGAAILGTITRIVENNREAVVSVARWATGIGLAGAALLSLGLTASATSVAIGGLLAMVTAATSGIGLLLIPLGLLGQAMKLLTAATVIARGAVVGLYTSFATMRALVLAAAGSAFALRAAAIATSAAMLLWRASVVATSASIVVMRATITAAAAAMRAYRAVVVAVQGAQVGFRAAALGMIASMAAVRAGILLSNTVAKAFWATLASLRAGFVALRSSTIGATVATTVFTTVAAIATTTISVLTSPLVLTAAALAAIGFAAFGASGALRTVGQSASDMLSRVGGSASAALPRLGQMFGELRTTATNAWRGISDALMAGDIGAAGMIAMKSLQLAFLQGLTAIDDIFNSALADTFGKITSQIIGGDFTGAWNTAVLGMSSLWESFSNGIVTGFVKASKAVVQTWRATVDELANYILNKAGEGGVFGAFIESISGVDVQAEMQRNADLKAQEASGGARRSITGEIEDIEAELAIETNPERLAELEQQLASAQESVNQVEAEIAVETNPGRIAELRQALAALKAEASDAEVAIDTHPERIELLTAQLETMKRDLENLDGGRMPDIFDEVANGTYSDPATQALADELNAKLDELQSFSDETADRANQALANEVQGEASKEVERLEGELAALRWKAEQARAYADAQPVEDNAAGAGDTAGANGNGGTPGGEGGNTGNSGKASLPTNNIYQLIASAQGLSKDPAVKAIDRQTKVLEEMSKKQDAKTDKMIDVMNNRLGMALV